jgi:ATP-dependent DNA helicase PIF1
MLLLSEKNKHEFDSKIKFQKEGHKYWINDDGTDLISATTFIKQFMGKFETDSVINNIINSNKYMNDPSYRYYKMKPEDIKKSWENEGNKSSSNGTQLHEDIELFYNNEFFNNSSIEFQHFLNFHEDHKNELTIYRTEFLIFSEIFKITGSVDALFLNSDGTYTICDWKRSKKIKFDSYSEETINKPFEHLLNCNFVQYSLQLNLYRVILEKFYKFKIRDMFLIVCHPENENDNYLKIEVDRMEDEGELLLCFRKKELIEKGYDIEFDFEEKIEKKIHNLYKTQVNIKKKSTPNKMSGYDIDYDDDEEIAIKPLLLKKKVPANIIVPPQKSIVDVDIGNGESKTDQLFNKGKKWSDDDDQKLLKLNSDLYDYNDISKLLGRTENSIRLRILLKAEYEFNNTSKTIQYICDEYKIKEDDLMTFRNDKEKEKIEKERQKKIKDSEKEEKKKIEKEKKEAFEKTLNELKFIKPSQKEPEILSEKQQYAFDLFLKGENIFITGFGGSGKSFFIKKACSYYSFRNIGVTSTTGTSAILINGTTLHSFLGIGLGNMEIAELYLHVKNKSYLHKRWKELEILIIDEISMLSPILFDKLEHLARIIRKNSKPFGGIQLILSGDFFQLPVIGETNSFCFDAESWNKCIPKKNVIYFDKNFRQGDIVFQNILKEIRYGKVSDKTMAILKTRVNAELVNEFGILPTKIFSLNRDVDNENELELNKLSLKNEKLEFMEYELTYDILKPNLTNVESKIKKTCNVPFTLQLCVGAQVMLLFNLDLDLKLCNGSRGVVVKFENELPVVRFLNGLTMVIEHKTWTVEENKVPVFMFTQIPLKVAFACSGHKSQGLSIDYAQVDLANIFEYGQAYVCLSRVRTLEGLSIKNLNKECFKTNQKVIDFYEDLL